MDLRQVSLGTLRALRAALRRGVVSAPVDASSLARHGFPGEGLAEALEGMAGAGIERLLDCVIAEREAQDTRLEVVWTGPDAGDPARDTGVVMRHLFGSARKSVLMAGYSVSHGERLFAPLHEAMDSHGVEATFVLDIKDPARSEGMVDAIAKKEATAFLEKQWRFAGARPELYFDPRSAIRGDRRTGRPWVSMHAKCVVIDCERVLITSANFTEQAQERNIELGVCIHDPDFATEVDARWRALIRDGALRRIIPSDA